MNYKAKLQDVKEAGRKTLARVRANQKANMLKNAGISTGSAFGIGVAEGVFGDEKGTVDLGVARVDLVNAAAVASIGLAFATKNEEAAAAAVGITSAAAYKMGASLGQEWSAD